SSRGGHGAVLYGGAAIRCRRIAWIGRGWGGVGQHPHPGRATHTARLAAARSERTNRGGPAALPPPRGDGLGHRRAVAHERRCGGETARRLLWHGGQLRRGEGTLRGFGGRRGPAAA